ncbi:bifunctional glycosyltransferase/CDP-glycerol:glycerophosphate glycerophosphotransferase [Glutamicibacter arilaitensis]|uniref:bifunctional glycosyltransferase/CDP-glycerol:glycerophosphate glycerophosphotransferase n=1 Tax=Glutamicibacter arilaitensis TaxID=256701 RepID=UPI003FD10708
MNSKIELNRDKHDELDGPPQFRTRPKVTIVSAVYNVQDYLDDYLSSLNRQESVHDLEVILVLDGSTDDSEQIIRQWSKSTSVTHKILVKPNGGQASARNLGIKSATSDWITFCDPDDYLADDYFTKLISFMGEDVQDQASMYVTRIVSFDEATGEMTHGHPLGKRFRDGNRLVDLNRSPNFFHMSGATAVVRRAELQRLNHFFNEELTFSFEDAHFVSSYLLQQEKPIIGICAESSYFYRRRAAGNSSVQISALKEEKYGQVIEAGHLDLLARAKESQGIVPEWLQMLLLYDIFWYFRGDRRVGAPSRRLSPEVQQKFHTLIEQVMSDISATSVLKFDLMPTDFDLRDALIFGYKEKQHRPSKVYVESIDVQRRMTLLRYTFSGDRPTEAITYKGLEVVPLHAKVRPISFFGRTLFSHRYLWIASNGTFDISIDGEQQELVLGKRTRTHYSLRPYTVSKALAGIDITRPAVKPSKSKLSSSKAHLTKFVKNVKKQILVTEKQKTAKNDDLLLKRASSVSNSRKFKNSWLFMDRIFRANDNAEHLYRHIQNNHPKINSWFILEQDSKDWNRLEKEGFRLIAHGTQEHKIALLNAQMYASSHLDKFVTNPLEGKLASKGKWKFVFLQHGVTVHDLSYWFNGKKIDLLVTSTTDEYRSIVGDDTAYRFSSKEVALTGFPRHDALVIDGQAKDAKWILVSPTWRQNLVGPSDASGKRTKIEGFSESEYALSWSGFLNSQKLKFIAEANNLKVGLLPHPSLADYVDDMNLDEHVKVLDWDDQPFAEYIRESAVLVTDYSSTAFEAAYGDVPVVYFQFDQEALKSGSHTYDSGYFEFETDGFGPVEVEVSSAIDATIQSIENGQSPEYRARIQSTFVHLDSLNSERVYQEMSKLVRPARHNEVFEP